jgi:hypothetical protein
LTALPTTGTFWDAVWIVRIAPLTPFVVLRTMLPTIGIEAFFLAMVFVIP